MSTPIELVVMQFWPFVTGRLIFFLEKNTLSLSSLVSRILFSFLDNGFEAGTFPAAKLDVDVSAMIIFVNIYTLPSVTETTITSKYIYIEVKENIQSIFLNIIEYK